MRKRDIENLMAKRAIALITLALALTFFTFNAATESVGAQEQEQESAGAETGVYRTDNFEMIVKAGFSKLEVNNWMGSWVPFRITLVNQGPPINGRLIVHCESALNPTPQIREYVKDIQLPTGSHQLHEIAAFLNSSEDPIVRIQKGDDIIAETKIRVERSYGWSDQLEIAVVDTDSTALNNITSIEIVRSQNREPFKSGPRMVASLQGQVVTATQGAQATSAPQTAGQAQQQQQSPQNRRQRRGGPGSGGPITAHPTVISPEDLPRDFISYDPLDVVVINDAPLNQLSEEQAHALKLWVASGGLLIVTGGSDISGMTLTKLEELLPIEGFTGGASSMLSLTELNQVYGPFDSEDKLSGMAARLRQGSRALVGTDDRPIVAERNYGSGLVRFVAIDPKQNPYRGWNAAKDLWADLLLPAAESKPKHSNWITVGRRGNNSSNRWGVHSFLYHLAQIEPPSPKYFLLFLLFYVLAVGPVNYLVLKWKRKTDLAWLTIPAVVIVFTIVSVTAAQMTRGGNSLIADVSLVEMHQSAGLTNINSALLVMPTSKGTQRMTFDGRDTYANDVYDNNQASSASASGNIESERGPREFTLRVPMTTWTSGIFQMRSVKENGSPLVSAQLSGGDVTIKNLGDAPMIRAVYLGPAGVSNLFDLEPGKEQLLKLGGPQSSTFNSWYQNELGQGNDESDLFLDLASLLDRQIGGDRAITQGFFETQLMPDALKRLERPMVICFVDDNPTEIDFSGSLKRRSKSLYVVHL